MQEQYAILKQSNSNIQIGYMYITDNKEGTVKLNPNNDAQNIPLHFRAAFEDGSFIVSSDKVFDWIITRIPPQYRQDISDILRSLGLAKYDEFEIFKAYKGRSVRDDYYIEKVNQ